MMTKRVVLSLVGGWIAGGVVFLTFFHQPLEYLAPALAFGTTMFLLVIFR